MGEGRSVKEVAEIVLEDCDFLDIRFRVKAARLGIELAFVANDRSGRQWSVRPSGSFTSTMAGLRRSDAL